MKKISFYIINLFLTKNIVKSIYILAYEKNVIKDPMHDWDNSIRSFSFHWKRKHRRVKREGGIGQELISTSSGFD